MSKSLTYVTRPLSDRSWLTPANERVASPFGPTRYEAKDRDKAENRWWRDTLDLLATELHHLRAENVVMGVDVQERHIRLDGMLYANARPDSPAVELAFDSRHGPLLYRLDRFTGSAPAYRHNVRAIALSLEKLRAVDRYGATRTGEQYAGWRQIEAAHVALPGPGAMNVAWEYVYRTAHPDDEVVPAMSDMHPDRTLRIAKRKAHPDTGAPRERWDTLHEAAITLGLDW